MEKILSFKKQLSFYKTGFPKNYYHLLVRKLAKLWLGANSQAKVIGIVGSFGKTTTTQVLSEFLGLSLPTLATDINLDTNYNLPLTILKTRYSHRYLVLEMGVDHKLEMDFHLNLVVPEILIFTGITPVHSDQEHLGSVEGVKKEKGKAIGPVVKRGGWVIANADDQSVQELMKKNKVKNILWYSTKNKKGDLWADSIKLDKKGTSFVVKTEGEEIKIKGEFWGEGYVAAFLATAGIAKILKLPFKDLVKTGGLVKALSGRMSLEKGPGGFWLLNDRLRANPASVKMGLETFGEIPASRGGRKIVVLGEMGELGEYAKKEHQGVGDLLEEMKFDQVIGIGPLLKETGKKTKITWTKDVGEAAEELKKLKLISKDMVYLKGSLLRHMERILLILEGKKVGCKVISCDFYHPCSECEYLKTGIKV